MEVELYSEHGTEKVSPAYCSICYTETGKIISCSGCYMVTCLSCLQTSIEFQIENLQNNIHCPNLIDYCPIILSERSHNDVFGSVWYKETYLKKKTNLQMENLLVKHSELDFEHVKEIYFEMLEIKKKKVEILRELTKKLGYNAIKTNKRKQKIKINLTYFKKDRVKVKTLIKDFGHANEKLKYYQKKIIKKLKENKNITEKVKFAKSIIYYCESSHCDGFVMLPNSKCSKCSQQYCSMCMEKTSGTTSETMPSSETHISSDSLPSFSVTPSSETHISSDSLPSSETHISSDSLPSFSVTPSSETHISSDSLPSSETHISSDSLPSFSVTPTIDVLQHVCNETKVKDFSDFMKKVKFCPICHTLCEKEGCDQVFCSNCKSVFNWNTLHIEHGKIHNVSALHYFGRLQERDIDDIPCGGVPKYKEFRNILNHFSNVGEFVRHILISVNISIRSVSFVTLLENKKRLLIQKFIMMDYFFNQVDKKKVILGLSKNEIQFFGKKREMDILKLYIHLAVERFRDFYLSLRYLFENRFGHLSLIIEDVLEHFFVGMNGLRLMINGQIQEQKKLSGHKLCYILDPYFKFRIVNDDSVTINEEKFEKDALKLKFNRASVTKEEEATQDVSMQEEATQNVSMQEDAKQNVSMREEATQNVSMREEATQNVSMQEDATQNVSMQEGGSR
jgi:hypothetical protein